MKTDPGLYVHVPFCLSKCPYCDFYSVTDVSLIDTFIGSLAKEAYLRRKEDHFFDSLYIGGGTPSLLPPLQIEALFSTLRSCFAFADDTEITYEMNPDDADAGKLALLRELKVNRVSLGVQSFNDRELSFLGRRHDAAGSRRALTAAREAGFTNIGVDLIYALPGQTLDTWRETLEEATSFKPTHVSCYQLTIEDDTPFGATVRSGLLERVGERRERELFLFTSRFLEAQGFLHYEVSNFARSADYTCRHNQKYWNHVPYLGLGPAAHSFDGIRRSWNCRSVSDYFLKIEEDGTAIDGSEELSAEQLRLERLYLGFRAMGGVERADLDRSETTGKMVRRLLRSRVIKNCGNRVVPTRKGYLIADRLPLLLG